MKRLIIPVFCAASISCEAGGAPSTAEVVRDTLPNGAVRLSYLHLPDPASEPVAAELAIGVLEGEPHEIFGDVRALEADADGTIYVLDHQASEVRAFDRDGRYLRTLTRRGDGPGELTAANGMVLDGDGTLWIQDHGKWSMLGIRPDGEEVARFPMHVLNYGYVWNGALDARGRFWKPTSHTDAPRTFPPPEGVQEGSARTYMSVLDREAESVDSVFLGERAFRSFVTHVGGGFRYHSIPFTAQPALIVDPAGGFWSAQGERYRVARLDERGDTVLVIEAAVEPRPVTREDRQEYVESFLERDPDGRRTAEALVALAPATKPVVDQLLVDDLGRLWVRRAGLPEPGGGNAGDGRPGGGQSGDPRLGGGDPHGPRYDVFDRDGAYLGSVRLAFRPSPFLPPRIRDGKLYVLVPDSLEVPTVVRAEVPRLAKSG